MADLSYLSFPNPDQFRYLSIIDVFKDKTNEAPENEICVERSVGGGRRSLTNADLLNRSTDIAKYLIAKGIRPGDSVAITGPNSIEWIIGEFAILMAGAVSVQIHKTSELFSETLKLLKSTKCNAVLIDPESDEDYVSDMEAHFGTEGSIKDIMVALLLRKSLPSSLLSLDDIVLNDAEKEVYLPRIQPESIALIFTTSGSTGFPKMVEYTHFAITNASYLSFFATAGNPPYGKCYNDRPFSWFAGSPLFSILNGNTRVFMNTAIGMKTGNILKIWDIIMAEQCTSAMLLPYAIFDILANLDTITKTGYKLYTIATGGQRIGSHVTEVCGKCTEKLIMGYGTTETAVVSYIEMAPEIEEGHVGSLLPGYEVKVIGDKKQILNRGLLGEILVRSAFTLKSYRNARDLNIASFTDHDWFRSGDIGIITTEGKLFLKGKSNDVIKRGGLKVLASIVEAAMSTFPEIREVVVIPVPDARLFEEVCACYVLKDYLNTTEVDLDKKCRVILGDNVLGNTPSYFLRFDSFPSLSNGKTDKVLLRKQAMKRLNLAGW
ncbi:medium-chain acyl-CoA ligase ACSF2, mitochondrial-like [Ylistrum balloti]|uniref:medium-chain acyl-CoA ligase ACSF2, mitochondrial-like n=1 Tax=Ylistrum balloti TaxID=509963 RepID=UPI002905CAD4|nr:medium-chain acyl-CoA ligase ACSF2, mitochondrial-like [Ylistrum balloti]